MRTRDFHRVEGKIEVIDTMLSDIRETLWVHNADTVYQMAVRSELKAAQSWLRRRRAIYDRQRRALLKTER